MIRYCHCHILYIDFNNVISRMWVFQHQSVPNSFIP